MHIAEKYVQLARDAQVSGDIVMAENYFQHAEHYFRMIAAAQPQVTGPGQMAFGRDDDGDEDFDAPSRPDFNSRPEPYGQPPRGNGSPYQGHEQGGQRGYEPRDRNNEHRGHDYRGQENRGQDNRGQDNRGQDNSRGQENRAHETRGQDDRGQDGRGPENRGYDRRDREPRYQENRGGEEGRGREGRPHGDAPRSYEPRYPAAEPRHGDRPHVNGNAAPPPAAAVAAPLPGLGPQPDFEPPVVAAAVPVAAVEAVEAAPVVGDDGTPRPRRRSRGSRGRGRRPEGAAGGEEGEDGAPALPFAEDAAATEG